VGLVGLHFIGALAGRQVGTVGRFLRHADTIFAPVRRLMPTVPTSQPCAASRARRCRGALPGVAVFIDEFEFVLAKMEVTKYRSRHPTVRTRFQSNLSQPAERLTIYMATLFDAIRARLQGPDRAALFFATSHGMRATGVMPCRLRL
jgi:hypothetical protein